MNYQIFYVAKNYFISLLNFNIFFPIFSFYNEIFLMLILSILEKSCKLLEISSY
jgi:hypothetical protein